MTKNTKYFQTFFSGIALSKDGVVRTKAIQDWAEQHKICGKRLVIDILNDMEELGIIEKARVKGMRKLEGWSIKEETEKPFVATVLHDCAETLRIASVLLWPFIPDACEEFWKRIGCDYTEQMAANGGRLTGRTHD